MVMKAVLAAANDTSAAAASSMLTGMQGLGAASIMLQTYSSTVLAQPDVSLSMLPDLPTQQKQARSSAQTWLSSTNPKAIVALADVRDFANHVSAYVNAILPLAQKYDLGDKSQLPQIMLGLQQMLALAQTKGVNASSLVDQSKLYESQIAANVAAFASAETAVQTKISGDQGEIANLRTQLATLNSRMNADVVQISAGAVSDIVGIGLIVIAATTVIETGGATQTLLAAGIALVAGGTLAMTISAADIVQAQKEYGSTLTALVGLELEVAAFDTVAHQITVNGAQAQSAVQAAGMLASGWANVVATYQDTLNDLQTNQKGYLALRLSAMKREWVNLGEQAQGLMAQGSLTFKTEPAASVAATG